MLPFIRNSLRQVYTVKKCISYKFIWKKLSIFPSQKKTLPQHQIQFKPPTRIKIPLSNTQCTQGMDRWYRGKPPNASRSALSLFTCKSWVAKYLVTLQLFGCWFFKFKDYSFCDMYINYHKHLLKEKFLCNLKVILIWSKRNM